MAYAILRVKKLKTAGAIRAVGQHNSRSRETPNANLAVPNRVLIQSRGAATPTTVVGGAGAERPAEAPFRDDALDAVQARIADAEARIRKNGVLACEVFMGASPEFFRPNGGNAGTWDEQRLDAWVPAAMEWIQREWGKPNVVSAVLHLDETTPHIQAVVVPIDPDTGRMNAARWLNGRKALSEMQDRYGEAMQEVGLQRGVRGSLAQHTEIREWYGHLRQPVTHVPEPAVQVPGMLVREQSREAFADRETERLMEYQRPAVAILETQARERHVAVTQRRETEATNRQLAETLKAERATRTAREAQLTQENTDLRAKQDDLRKQLDSFRRIPLAEAAAWFDPQELAEAGVRIGTDAHGRERIFGADGKVIGRNAVDLAKHVHGCPTAEEAVAWIEIRQGPIAADRAITSLVEPLRAAAQPIRDQMRNAQHPMWRRRYQWARQQASARRPKTWSAFQAIFGRMRFEVGRKKIPQGFQYQLQDHLCRIEMNPFDLVSFGAPPSGPNVLGNLIHEWEQQEQEARLHREQEEAAQVRRSMNRGARR